MTTRTPNFRAEATGSDAALHLYDEIGGWGVRPGDVIKALDELKAGGAKALHVYVNSPGGDVFDGMAIYNAIKRWSGEKVVHVDGLCASMASVIAMAGDKIVTAANAIWMIHEPWGLVVGDAGELRKRAELLDTLAGTIRDTYQRRTKQTASDLAGWMADETWMSASEAKARGFTDEITEQQNESDTSASADLSRFPVLAKFRRTPTEQVARLLASAHTPAATSRSTPPQAAISQEAAKMDPVATPAPAPAASVTMSKDELQALINGAVKQAVASVPAHDPSATAVAAAAASANHPAPAPMIGRFATPRAALGREQRSDEQCASATAKRGLPMARTALAVMRRNEVPGMSLAEAAENLGFRTTAEKIDSIAKGAAMTEGDATSGGSFVPVDFQAGFIDSLSDSVTIRPLIPAGNIVRSSREQIQWPKLTGGLTGAWVGENPSGGTPEALSTGSLTLRARKQRIEVLVSRDLLRDAASNIDQIIQAKLALRSAQLEDLALVEGKGTENEPKGLKLWASSANVTGATAVPDYSKARVDLRKLLKLLSNAKVPASLGRAFVGHEIHKWGLGDYADAVGGFPLDASNGKLLGYDAAFSTQLVSTAGATNCFYLFAPGAAILFDSLQMMIENDNAYTNASGTAVIVSSADQTVLRLWRRMDFGMEYPEAVAYLTTCPWGQ